MYKNKTVNTNIKDLWLLRHGDTGFDNKYIGASDVPLSDNGRLQIRRLSKSLEGQRFDRILVSPMKRCLETLRILKPLGNTEIVDGLREVDFGRWEKKCFSQLLEEDSEEVQKWVDEPATFCFPGGESRPLFIRRISLQAQAISQLSENKILIICHGGVIRHLLCLFLRLPIENYLLFNIKPGMYSTVRLYDEGGILNGLNYG